MKKTISIILIIACLLSCAACGEVSTKVNVNEVAVKELNINTDALPVDASVYTEIEPLLGSIEKFIEYNHIMNNTINYDAVGAEDFWNIVAIVLANYKYKEDVASIDVAGTYHVEWDYALEFAKTFMYNSWFKNKAPSYGGSYSATADPGTGIIDLIPLNVDNFDAGLEYITEAPEGSDYDYVMFISLANREGTSIYHYAVYIAEWESYLSEVFNIENADADLHFTPYLVACYRFLNSEDIELPAEEEQAQPEAETKQQ